MTCLVSLKDIRRWLGIRENGSIRMVQSVFELHIHPVDWMASEGISGPGRTEVGNQPRQMNNGNKCPRLQHLIHTSTPPVHVVEVPIAERQAKPVPDVVMHQDIQAPPIHVLYYRWRRNGDAA